MTYYARFEPPPGLSQVIESIWVQEDLTDAATHYFPPTRVLPTGFVDIAFYYLDPFLAIGGRRHHRLSSAVVTGPQSTFRMYAATGRTGIVIARFWPGAASAFFPQPLHELRDTNVDLADLIAPASVQEITQRVRDGKCPQDRVAELTAFLESRLRASRGSLNARQAVERAIAGGGSGTVGDLARTLHVGSRQLQRWFRDNVGIGPKTLGRIIRFQRALDVRASGLSWAMTAYTAGYQDQSHLANECRALSGLSPVEVLRRRRATPLAKHFNGGPGGTPNRGTLYV